jgi:hypothetical protein
VTVADRPDDKLLPDRDNGTMEPRLLGDGGGEECPHTRFGPRTLGGFADDIGVNQPKKAAFTQRRKDAKIFQAVSSAMPFT